MPTSPKAAPQLLPEPSGRWRRLLDHIWLVWLIVRLAPLVCALWTGLTLAEGLLVPAQLWLTKTVVDALAAQLAGAGDQGLPFWLAVLAGTLLAERAIGGLQPWLVTKVKEDVGPKLQAQVMEQAAGLDVATFESQAYYDQISRILSDAETRGPPMIGQPLGLLRVVPALLGYAVALATLTPALLAITVAAWTPALTLYFIGG
ncbi:MAG: hypothetical protein ACRDI2_10195 [Chloroflexota bacterium]